MAEAVDQVITIKNGYGPWRVTYHEGVPVHIETWETDPVTATPTAKHQIRREGPVIIKPGTTIDP